MKRWVFAQRSHAQFGLPLPESSQTITTAESCTGGLLSHVLTSVSGSSRYFVGGVVAYSNQIKEAILGVRPETLQAFGAVSEQTAREMAEGIRQKFEADFGLSTTGIAGPTGGTPEKPVGLVWVGISTPDRTLAYECHFDADREGVKTQTVERLLSLLIEEISPTKR
ncbi:MAG: CinA family protein [Brevefilum sp.]